MPVIDSIAREFSECLNSGMVTNNSKYVCKFEQMLQEYLSSKIRPICFNNGEMALFHLIQAWKIKLGYDIYDSFDVLVPSFTFSGTVNAIVMNNLKPVFCDVDDTLTLDINKIDKIDKNIKMVVAVSVYGNLPDIDTIVQFADANKLALIFDNAPGFGSTYKEKYPNYYGYSEIYSFHATKIISSMEGGAAVVNDHEISSILKKLRDFGQYEKERGDIDTPGLNSKMQEISAIVGIKNLEKIDYIITEKKKNIRRYEDFFQNLEKEGNLKNMRVRNDVFCTYLYYPIILNEDATDFVTYLNQEDIACRRYYTAVHSLKLYRNKFMCDKRSTCSCSGYCQEEEGLKYTNSIKDRIVSLPIHTEMKKEEIEYLFNTCKKYFKD
jgi:dTDP-4-amino-4,6-dideoxygalactose transaminase